MAGDAVPREGQGFRAEIRFGNAHLVLMAVHTGLGPAMAIFDAKSGKWWPQREWADDIEDAKQKAERHARAYCRAVDPRSPLPEIRWAETG